MSRIPHISSAHILFFLVLFSAFFLQFIMPWWIVVVVGFLAGLVSARRPWQNFLIVFAAIGSLWLGASLYITFTESTVLLPRMAGLLQLPHAWMLFVVTVLTSALPASLAALGSSWLITRDAETAGDI